MSFIPEAPNDKCKEAFRRYLERAGVVDAITSALVTLFGLEEKPEDPLDFLRRHLGDPRPEVADYEAVLSELDAAKGEVEELTRRVDSLRGRLSVYEEVDSPAPSGDDVDHST